MGRRISLLAVIVATLACLTLPAQAQNKIFFGPNKGQEVQSQLEYQLKFYEEMNGKVENMVKQQTATNEFLKQMVESQKQQQEVMKLLQESLSGKDAAASSGGTPTAANGKENDRDLLFKALARTIQEQENTNKKLDELIKSHKQSAQYMQAYFATTEQR